MQTRIKARVVRVGNSRGIRIPKPVIEQLGFTDEVELEIFADRLVVRSTRTPRASWDQQFKAMAEAGDDTLLDGDGASLSEWDGAEWEW